MLHYKYTDYKGFILSGRPDPVIDNLDAQRNGGNREEVLPHNDMLTLRSPSRVVRYVVDCSLTAKGVYICQ